MSLEVDLADLAASAVVVTAHGEDLAARHVDASSRIDDAAAGWRGLSADALGEVVVRWMASTVALTARLRDHTSALHSSASGFADHEQRSAAALESLR